MSEIFISYARSTEDQARRIAEALRALGYGVWRDDELPTHRAYADVILERLSASRAVVVVWSAEAVKSQWVRSEAERARNDGKLVQLSLDGAPLPMPFDQIQCADLSGGLDSPSWKRVVESLAELTGKGDGNGGDKPAPDASPARVSICVLPFANMSGEPEQEYFSDGVSEDIITDLSKVSALSVVSRNSAFQFKGRHVDVRQAARQLGVSHVLEGSVRKAGDKVRITAQLIDAARDSHVWAERYDRQLTDIFALQDEISQSIVAALKLRLLPEERRAIQRRGTASPEAYDLYLSARQLFVSGNTNQAGHEAIIRLCRRALEIDPDYAQACALLAQNEATLHWRYGQPGESGLATAERAVMLDASLAEPHAVLGRYMMELGRDADSEREIETALRLDPESFEVNMNAGYVRFRQGRQGDAVSYFEHASRLSDASFAAAGMLMSAYVGVGDADGVRRAAQMTVSRVEKAIAEDRLNAQALGFGASALAALGDGPRAREWISRALLIDPDSRSMRYNLACGLSAHLKDVEGALALLGPYLATASSGEVRHARVDPELDPLRSDPRFEEMASAAERRVAGAA
jgi:adenylate cyclase